MKQFFIQATTNGPLKTLRNFQVRNSRQMLLYEQMTFAYNPMKNVHDQFLKRSPRVLPVRDKKNISSGHIPHLLQNIFQHLITSAISKPSLNRKKFEIFQYLRINKIFKTINSFCPSSLHIFQQIYVRHIYSKFQTHEYNSTKNLLRLIYRVDMNSLEQQNVEFSKFTEISELFPTIDLMCP